MKRPGAVLIGLLLATSLAWGADTATTTLRVEGMTCGGCVPAVNAQLKRTDGVLSYEVSFERGEAVVRYDPAKTTPEKIAESVTKTGYSAAVKGLAAAASAGASASARAATGSGEGLERVSLFQVPLMCPAVKGLGCGGKARPFMTELEKTPLVSEAWLNHPGTVLAVVWKEPQPRSHGSAVVGSVFKAGGLSVTALEGGPLNEALQEFATRDRWYRGQEVNRLSEQEGLVFTERMARRVESRTKLTPAGSAALRADLKKFCIDSLVGRSGRDTKALLEQAGKYMDPAQLKIYEEALKEGFQALPGESPS